MESLTNILEARMAKQMLLARCNYWSMIGLLILAIVSTTIATSAAMETSWIPKCLQITTTLLPGMVAIATAVLQLDMKAQWHWEKAHRLDELLRALTYEKKQEPEISKSLSEMNTEMDKKWPSFGALPVKPAK